MTLHLFALHLAFMSLAFVLMLMIGTLTLYLRGRH